MRSARSFHVPPMGVHHNAPSLSARQRRLALVLRPAVPQRARTGSCKLAGEPRLGTRCAWTITTSWLGTAICSTGARSRAGAAEAASCPSAPPLSPSACPESHQKIKQPRCVLPFGASFVAVIGKSSDLRRANISVLEADERQCLTAGDLNAAATVGTGLGVAAPNDCAQRGHTTASARSLVSVHGLQVKTRPIHNHPGSQYACALVLIAHPA